MKKLDQIFNQVKYRGLLLFPPIIIFMISSILRLEIAIYVSGIWMLLGLFLLLLIDFRKNQHLDNIDNDN
jgi:uncharacterized membrane protein